MQNLIHFIQRDQRGMAPANCESEVNGDLVGWLGSSFRYKRLYPALASVVSPEQTIYFPHRTLFQFMCPHRPAAWAGSRAVPPVSECVSPVLSFSFSACNSLSTNL
jgi:hypothetical protein